MLRSVFAGHSRVTKNDGDVTGVRHRHGPRTDGNAAIGGELRHHGVMGSPPIARLDGFFREDPMDP